MQNGRGDQSDRGSYNYTAASGQKSRSGANNNSAPAGTAQSQPNRSGAQGQPNRQGSGRQPGAAYNTQNGAPGQRSASGQTAQGQRPATGQRNMSAQSTSAQGSAQNRQNLPSQNSRAAGRRNGGSGSQSVVRSGERRVSDGSGRRGRRGGLVGYWKGVFSLSQGEIERSAVVPREVGGFDYVFLIIVLVLLAFGTVMVYSASYAYSSTRYGDSYYIITRQAIFVVIGLVLMVVAMFVKPDFYKRVAPFIYIVCFIMLCLVPIPGIGVIKKGARRWINVGVDVQPSEAMKFGLAIMLAWYFDKYRERIQNYKNFWRASFFGDFVPYAIVGVTCLLIVLEKHLSGTVIMFLIGTLVIFAGGALKRWIFGLFGAGAAALLVLGLFTDYTKRRFDLWLHPEDYPLDGGWQTLQGLYAIGSGGFFGVGIGESRQKHMYVSEPQNDFIFTIVCEELGFIGAVAVIALFMLFIYRGIVIAMRAPDTFSSLLVTGIVGKVAIQALLNIAVVTASIPNTGISLPFFSYGGTSLCILMAEMGVVLSISRYSKQRK